MNKRAFLEGFFAASSVAFGGLYMWQRLNQNPAGMDQTDPAVVSTPNSEKALANAAVGESYRLTPVDLEQGMPEKGLPAPAPVLQQPVEVASLSDQQVSDYLRKIRNFDAIFASDIYLDPKYEATLVKTATHLRRVERYIGHGNFNLMGFDDMLRAGRNFPFIAEFEADELKFLEEIFFANPNRYGFFGEKISHHITEVIPRNEVAKIGDTGHYLLKGESLNLYEQIRKDVGNRVVLTSGVRSNVKQMHLFLAKAIESNGNLSRASRSLAPPGHSYHGIGDFDIGKIGLGEKNFTADFSRTEEYRKIIQLGYIDIRYPTDNLFGVRFEPWHIKINS